MIIEIFGSLALNLECGTFVAIMAREATTNGKFSQRYIPTSLGSTTTSVLVIFTAITFSLAVVYDVLTAGVKWFGWLGWFLVLLVIFLVVVGGVWVYRKYSRRTSVVREIGNGERRRREVVESS